MLRTPWEALEGASPLTGNGAKTESLESGGRRGWEAGTLEPSHGRGHPEPGRPRIDGGRGRTSAGGRDLAH